MGISPADTYDTVPLSDSPSRSFGSRASYDKRRSTNQHDNRDDRSNNSNNDYLPVSLLNFDSPRNGARSNVNSNNNDKNTSKVVIEHKIKDSNRGRSRSAFGGGSSLLCLVKPLLLFLFLAVLVSGAASVYGWLFKFPALNQQVEALEEQVVRLHGEVDRLETENDRYENLNDRLDTTVGDLEVVRNDLNGTASDLEDVASALNTTKDQIVAEIEQLKGQNSEYVRLNQGLQANVMELAGEIEFFREALGELTDEHSILQNTTASLQDLAMQFSNTTIDQNETLAVLKDTLEGFQTENDRLEVFNEKLETGLNYLNETLFANGNLVQSSAATLVEISEVLGEQVQQQQRSTLRQLEISYRQLLAGWDCDYRDVFRSESYGQNYELVLPPATGENPSILATTSGIVIPLEVQNYIDERVLSKLCLDPDDFQKYLSSIADELDAEGVTSNQLIRAVVLYTEDAMQYYFSSSVDADSNNGDSGSTTTTPKDASGIPLSEWIDASFRCDLLKSPFAARKDSLNSNGISVRKQRLFHLRRRQRQRW